MMCNRSLIMTRRTLSWTTNVLCAAVLAALTPTQRATAFDPLIDSPMYKLPELPFAPIEMRLPDGAVHLWLEFLERPEADYRCKAAQTIAEARRRGYKQVQDAIPDLIEAFDRAPIELHQQIVNVFRADIDERRHRVERLAVSKRTTREDRVSRERHISPARFSERSHIRGRIRRRLLRRRPSPDWRPASRRLQEWAWNSPVNQICISRKVMR